MKQTITKYMFTEAFRQYGRSEQFSYLGLQALFDYLEEMEEGTGEEMELDVIALCCDFSEYATAKEAAEDYGWTAPERDEDEDEEAYAERIEEEALEHLNDETQVIKHDSGVIVAAY